MQSSEARLVVAAKSAAASASIEGPVRVCYVLRPVPPRRDTAALRQMGNCVAADSSQHTLFAECVEAA